MKKYILGGTIVLVVLTLVFSFNHKVKAIDLSTAAVDGEVSNPILLPIWGVIRTLSERVHVLEGKVAELFAQITNIQLTPGPQGPIGPQGPKGDKGDQGNPGTNATALHLYDANGQDLGILLGMPPSDLANYKYQTYLPGAKISLRLTQNLEFKGDCCRIASRSS